MDLQNKLLSLLLITLVWCSGADGQFSNVASENGINLINSNPLFGNGVCFYDIDGDGWDDLTLGTKNQGIKFYRNTGGSYVAWNLSFSPGIPVNLDIKAVLWLDYDNDGDKDFMYSGILNPGVGNWPVKLYNNDGNNNFTDVSIAAGLLPETPQIFGISAGDYDNDGFLDLFVCKYHNVQFFSGYQYSNRLYHNNGDGTFSDATLEAELPTPIQASFFAVFMDYDRDGFQDIYVVNDRYEYENFMYHNDGDGTFTDVSESSGTDIAIEAMTACVADYDHDSDLDVFVSNTVLGNAVLNNQGDGTFVDVAEDAGLIAYKVCWGANWIDYDNNAWEDIYILTVGSGITTQDQNLFFKNNEDGTFTQYNTEVGLANDMDGSYCTAMGDMNNDGYYDMVNNNTVHAADLYLNDGGANHYLCATLEGTFSNKDGIGAWIDLYADGLHMVRYTFSAESYMNQNSEKEIFGLGSIEVVDSLTIEWLGGFTETYYELEVDNCYHFVEGQSTIQVPAEVSYEGDLFICPGESILLTAQEGQSYLWSNGLTDQTITVSEPGTYTVGVENIYGLFQNSNPITVAYAPELVWEESVTDVSCNGQADGLASIVIEGEGNIVVWNNESIGISIDSLVPGEYFYAITDTLGCPYQGSIIINEPPLIEASVTTTDVLCSSGNTGTAVVSVIGGNGEPFSYTWSGDADPQALLAGEYEVTVEDPLGCSTTLSFVINEPEELTALVTTVNGETGLGDGEASVTISGGTEPYEILWSTGEIDVTEVSGLFIDTYYVEITDANGCQINLPFEIFIGISEANTQLVKVYPNPAHDLVIVEWNLPLQDIVLFDQLGEEVRRINGLNKTIVQIDIEGLEAGMYHLRINSSSGSSSCTRSLVID